VTLQRRLTSALAILGVVLLGVTAVSTAIIHRFLYQQLEEPLRRNPLVPGNGPLLASVAQRVDVCRFASVDGNSTVVVALPDGSVFAPCPEVPTPRVAFTELALEPGESSPMFDADDESGKSFRMRVARLADGRYIGVGVALRGTQQAIRAIVAVQLAAILVALSALWLVGSWFARHGIRSLTRIGVTARSITAGDRSQRLELRADDPAELRDVASALNEMLDESDRSFTTVADALDQRERSELRLRQFVSDASHELKTPLTSIQGYGELLETGVVSAPEAVVDTSKRIRAEANRMSRLVNDMLRLAQLDAEPRLRIGSVDVGEVVRAAVADSHAADARWPVESVVDGHAETPLLALADRDALHQVIINLLTNVRQHTDPGTATTITVKADASDVTIQIADDGPGIAEEMLAHVFERFVRADASRSRRTGGSGLGLSIARALVRAQHGTITAGNRDAGGAVITIRLRRVDHARPDSPQI
jgi:two-component system, OmpR family, sensor kinase